MTAIYLQPGSVFAEDFRVQRALKEGGMGAVYVAEQLSVGAPRALKLMQPQLVRDPIMRKRFEQESRIGARIASDHVVQVVAAGVDGATGYPWMAMELLEGADLDTVLERRGALPPPEVQEIFKQLCHALAAAHAAGIVHREPTVPSRKGSSFFRARRDAWEDRRPPRWARRSPHIRAARWQVGPVAAACSLRWSPLIAPFGGECRITARRARLR